MVGIPHPLRVSSWPLRALLEARVLSGLVAGQRKVLECRRLLGQWEHDCVLSVHYSVALFRPLQVRSLERSVWRRATRDGEWRQTGRKFSWGLVWGALPHTPTHTHTCARAHIHTHTLADVCASTEYRYINICIFSNTQYGNKAYAKCTRDHIHIHIHIHIHQLQLMPTSRSRDVLVVSPRSAVSRVCILLYMSSYVAGRWYPNIISPRLGLNETCGVLRSFNSFFPSLTSPVSVCWPGRVLLTSWTRCKQSRPGQRFREQLFAKSNNRNNRVILRFRVKGQ